MLIEQLKKFDFKKFKKVRVFWDLEETVIDSWESQLLCNISKTQDLISYLNDEFETINHELYSYAVLNQDLCQFEYTRNVLKNAFGIDFLQGMLADEDVRMSLNVNEKNNIFNYANLFTVDVFYHLYESSKTQFINRSLFYSIADKATMMRTILSNEAFYKFFSEELWIVVDDTVCIEQFIGENHNVIFLNPKKSKKK